MFKISNSKNIFKRGFTLIELLVVISIIGVLSALLMSNMQDARGRARDTQRKNDLKEVQKAIEMYRQDKNTVPADGWSALTTALESGGQMKEVPIDPLNSGGYAYYYTFISQYEFRLVACLENASDPSADQTKDANCNSAKASYTLTEP